MPDSRAIVDRIVSIVADEWDELPGHFGDRWIEVFPRIAELASRLAATTDLDERSVAAMQLAMLFVGHPTLAPRLRDTTSPYRGAGPSPMGGGDGAAVDVLRSRIAATAAARYTDIFAPSRLRTGERGVLTVRLTRSPLAASVSPAHLPEGERFEVRVHAPALAVEGDPVRALDIAPNTDSETAVFYLTALAPSTAGVTIDVLRKGVLAATRHVALSVVAEEVGAASVREGLEVAPSHLTPADVELRVLESTRDGATVLSFFLHSPNGSAGFHHYPAGEVVLAGSPQAYQQRVLRDLEARHGSRGARRQRALGYQLYRELLPAPLRAAYRELAKLPVRTLHITSDEPWIPWELVLPDEDDLADDHWCVRFELTRWLAGPIGPPAQVTARSLAFLEASVPPGAVPLTAVADERAHLEALARKCGLADHSPVQADSAAVDALLDTASQVGLWHFAGHGDVSAVLLADGVRLTPDELAGPRRTALRSRRPLVFLNACRAGRQESGWTGLGGWAEAWARRCWSPFVGPLWNVTDKPAAFLASMFYDELSGGASVGRAMTHARLATRQRWPDDPTWLAYSVYAHPNTTVAFLSSA